MKMETKTHWKKLTNPDYLGSYDFQPGEERIVTVKKVVREMVAGADGKKEECTVCHFNENYKPMILNSTNSKMITKLADSPYIEDWAGVSFKILVQKIKAFGDWVEALRIKSEKVVKQLPELIAGSENFTKCKAAITSKAFTIDQIKAKYKVSEAVEKELLA